MATNDIVINFSAKDGVSPALKSMESNVIRFVGAISAAVAAVSTIAFPIVSSAAYQRELLEAAKTTNYTAQQTDSLRKGLTELSTQIDVSAADLAKIATMGGQLGIGSGGNTSALLSFTEEIARAVTALDIPAEEAAVSLGKLINIFDIKPGQFKNAIASLNEVSNVSNATASELFDVTRRIGNLGGSVKFPEAVALSATMIDLGLTAETAGTTLTKVFANMKAKAGDFANFVGVSTGEWTELITNNGIGALNKYIERLNQVPTAYAAQQKIALTGGGRLFEAMSKLQEQQRRGDALNKKSQELLAKAESGVDDDGVTKLGEKRLEVLKKQSASLSEQATKANALSRLIGSATSAFEEGTSAQREQQLVLGGLSRQWQVFQNNISAFGFVIGDSFLLPLTDGLKSLSEAFTNVDTLDKLKKSLSGIVSTVSAASNALGALVDKFITVKDSSGFDIGAALRIGTAATAMVALTGAFTLLIALVSTITSKIPVLGGLSKFFFGASVAAKATNTEMIKTAGLLGRLGETATAYVVKQQNIAQLQATINAGMAQSVTLQADLAAAQARHSALLATQPPRLQTIAAMEAKLLTLEASRTAAIAAGNAANVTRYSRNIANLQAVIVGLNLEAEAMARLTAAINQQSGALATERTMLAGMVASVSRFELALRKAGVAGSTGFAAVSRWAGKIRTNLVGALPPSITSSATYAKMVAGWKAVTNEVGILTFALKQAGVATVALGAKMAGTGALFTAGMGAMAYSAAVLATGVSLIGTAFRALVGFLGKAFNVAFFAYMAYEILNMLGLIDKLKTAIAKLLIALGVPESYLPDWLTQASAMAELVDQTDAEKDAMKALTKEAQKYNNELATRNGLLAFGSKKENGLEFDPDNPTGQRLAVASGVEAINAAAAAGLKVEQDRKTVEADLVEKLKKRLELTDKIATIRKAEAEAEKFAGGKVSAFIPFSSSIATASSVGAGAFADSLQKDLDDVNASIAFTEQGLKSLGEVAEEISVNGDALANLAKALFTQQEAVGLFAGDTEGAASAFEEYADAAYEAQVATDAYNRAIADQGGDQNAGDGAASRRTAMLVEVANAKVAMNQRVAIAQQLQNRLRAIAPGANLEEFVKVSPSTAQSIAARMKAEVGKAAAQFTGSAKPIITANTLLDTAALIYTKKQIKSTYEQMAETAKARAEEAKNAVTNAVTETTSRLLELDKRLRKIAQQANDATRTAKNQILDRSLDSKERAAAQKRDQDKEIELKLLEERFTATNAALAEAAAGGINVNRNMEASFREHADAVFAVEERYRSLGETAEDAIEFGKAKRGLDSQLSQFSSLEDQATGYRARLSELNALLASGKLSTQAGADAERERQQVLDDTVANYEEMKALSEAISSIDPVAGRELLSDKQRGRLQEGLRGAATGLNQQQIAGAKNTSDVMNKAAAALEVNVQTIEESIKGLQGYLNSMVESVGLTGSEFQTAFEKIAEGSISAKQAFADLTASAEQQSANFQLTPVLGEGGVDKLTEDIKNILQRDIADKTWTVGALTIEAGLLKIDETKLPQIQKLGVSPDAISGAGQAITDATKIKPVDVYVNLIPQSQLDILGAVRGTAPPPQRNADGGYIRGAGTATSDSILSWLSNGEYVMDAHSTKTFGSGFFAFLQKLARGGGGLSNLSKYGVPRFANGGAVGGSVSQLSGIATNFNKGSDAPSSKVEITINSGGKRATIQAEREQANALVGILRNFDKG